MARFVAVKLHTHKSFVLKTKQYCFLLMKYCSLFSAGIAVISTMNIQKKTKAYLLNKSLELVKCGMNTVLDWGFWKKSERKAVKEFFNVRDMVCEVICV